VFIPSHIQLPDFEKFVSAILYHKDRIYVAIKKVVLCYDMKVSQIAIYDALGYLTACRKGTDLEQFIFVSFH